MKAEHFDSAICLSLILILCNGRVLLADEKGDQIKALQNRARILETRIAELEQGPQPGMATVQQRKALAAEAQQRMRQDTAKYKIEQIRDAEQLYQVANRDWRSAAARDNLKTMVEKYPDLNRTGCAVLYLGQWSQGDDRERYLKMAIEKYSDCFYGDGAQVGAYARLLLAFYYQQHNRPENAKPLFDELQQKYPQAIDHNGKLISAAVEQLKNPPATQPR